VIVTATALVAVLLALELEGEAPPAAPAPDVLLSDDPPLLEQPAASRAAPAIDAMISCLVMGITSTR
jgi:hypothetical protein